MGSPANSIPAQHVPEIQVWTQPRHLAVSKQALSEKRTSSLGSIAILSDDLLLKLFKRIDPHLLLTLSLVSHYFYYLVHNEPMWKKRCLKKHVSLDKIGKFQHKKSWMRTYFRPEAIPLDQIPPLNPIVIKDIHSSGFYSEWWRRSYPTELLQVPEPFEKLDKRSDLTLEEFINEYESKNKPVILKGALKGWKACQEWLPKRFSELFGDTLFKTNGIDWRGKCFKMKFDDYYAYCMNNFDHKPIYLFDNRFTERIPEMVSHWEIPKYFRQDLFDEMTKEDRPDWRWFLIGPEKSGSPLHQDPHRTSAWNALICGRKRWALYPPEVIPPAVNEKLIDTEYYAAPEVLKWYTEVYPHLKPNQLPLEGTQEAGDIIFVPSGWWHTVLNLDYAVAVTQNFCSKQNFELVYKDLFDRQSKTLRKDFENSTKEKFKELYDEFFKKYSLEELINQRKVYPSSSSSEEETTTSSEESSDEE